MTPEELHAHTLQALERRKQESLRLTALYRGEKAQAEAAGQTSIAKTLGLLAANMEKAAALAEAERRDRITRHDTLQAGRKARDSSKATRQDTAARAHAAVETLFAQVWRSGMGKVSLAAAAKAELDRRENKLRDELSVFLSVRNKRGERRAQRDIAEIEKQRALCGPHYAESWRKRHATTR
jgi:hypothetical protein